MINLTLLGTSCMVPTKERNVSGFYLDYNGEGLLFDCGEGTQRQMNIANINRNKVKKILISHWHADHTSGILGLLHTISNNQDLITIEIYGPKDTEDKFNHLLKSSYLGNIMKLNIKIKELDINKLTKFYENDLYYLEAIPLDHNIPTLAYSFIEKDKRKIAVSKTKQVGIPDGPHMSKFQQGKSIIYKGKKYNYEDYTYLVHGKKITFVMDTSYTKNILSIAKNSNLLICEATYLDKHLEKSEQHKHLTVKQAAQIAHSTNSEKLVMTHFSQRYKDTTELENEARDIFPESYAGFDFMKLKL
jgi:ribonuclease Z